VRRVVILAVLGALSIPTPAAAGETSRPLEVRPGWWTARVQVRSDTAGGYVALRGCGGRERRTAVPVVADWVEIVVSTRVRSSGRCRAVLGGPAEFGELRLERGRVPEPFLGGDVSSLKKSEDLGGVYRDPSGRRGDALRILHAAGTDWVRLRVWVDPADGYHDHAELLEMARRARAAGLRVLVDLHYSDFWADPGKQWTPAAWEGKSFPELKATFTAYTRGIVRSLVAQGTPPDMVQLGNEINPGMLWDYGATFTGCSTADDGAGGQRRECFRENWDQLAQLLTAGHQAVKWASPRTKVMLHLAEGGKNDTFRWWFDNVSARNVPFDVIGASFYGYWHGTLAALQANLRDVSVKYGKDVIVAETAYPFTLADEDGWENVINLESELIPGYPATPAGQAAWLRDLRATVRAVPRGLGVFWWDSTWTAVEGNGWSPRDPSTGNAWENQALFGFDDRLLPAAWSAAGS
jgi:arabinogalactan endo-1,4-beta-galactosidase